MEHKIVRTRFAPSPTGLLHPGNMRTALINALYARHFNGAFIVRIEDTDAVRHLDAAEDAMLNVLRWLGLEWAEGPDKGGAYGPYRQSERRELHAEALNRLIELGQAYPCFCTDEELTAARIQQQARGEPPRYPGTCRHLDQETIRAKRKAGLPETLRFAVPRGQRIDFEDIVHGRAETISDSIGDFVLCRSDGTVTFLVANALDDAEMGITHVLRGDDHLANTPRQILLLKALDRPIPGYGHLPLVLGNGPRPLSKRDDSLSMGALQKRGYLPKALINYLARLGTAEQRTSLEDFVSLAEAFDPGGLSRSAARFDERQLNHWQHLAVQSLSVEELEKWLGTQDEVPEHRRAAFYGAIQNNILLPEHAARWAERIWGEPEMDAEADEVIRQTSPRFWAESGMLAAKMEWPEFARALRETTGLRGKALFMPIRVALTGSLHGPALADLWQLLTPAERARRFSRFQQLN